MLKDFSEFAAILEAHADDFQNSALETISRASENGVVDIHKLVGLLPALNLKTCVECLELYHEWICSQEL